MRKLLTTTALLATFLSAKAQTGTSKCGCETDDKIAHWVYSVKVGYERMESPEWNDYIVVDWAKMEIRTRDGAVKIEKYLVSAEEAKSTIWYGAELTALTIHYDNWGRYIGHEVQ